MILEIKTLSNTLIGSGEGSATIDIDIIFDDYGLPYIPSRRIKGILRSSAEEICDILGINGKNLIEQIFGMHGKKEGKIRIDTLRILEYEDIIDGLKSIKNNGKLKIGNLVTKNRIINHFTEIRQQTAINEDGVAQEHSVRTIRVIKPNLTFEGEIQEIDVLSEKEKALLYLAAFIFRRIGTARSRGFGEVKCKIKQIGVSSINEAINKIKNETQIKNDKKDLTTKNANNFDKNFLKSYANIKKLSIIIKTCSPVLISKQVGEQNTVNTKKYFPSTSILGLFASKFIKKYNLKENAHENAIFRSFFLDEKLFFTPAFPFKSEMEFYPTPLFLEKEKRMPEEPYLPIYNVIYNEPENVETEPLGGFLAIRENNAYKYVPKTVFYFHNVKKSFSGKNERRIFYYEAIDEGEEFKGYIMGNETILNEFIQIFEKQIRAYMGRSKTAQYGKVEITLGNIEDMSVELKSKEFILEFLSPVILYNDHGFQDISEKILNNYLNEFFGCTVEIKKSIVKYDFHEKFMGIWKMKTPREITIAPRSVFEIRVENCDNLEEKLRELTIYGVGEGRARGFGKVKVFEDLYDEYTLQNLSVRPKSTTATITKNTLRDLLEKILIDELKNYSEYKGFEKAKDFKFKDIISNHFLGKLEGMLGASNDWSEWKQKIGVLKEKHENRKSQQVRLLRQLEKFFILKSFREERDYNVFNFEKMVSEIKFKNDNMDWLLSKIYWRSFFRNLRIMKKRMLRDNE